MGTLQLNCPLCCNETFTSHETLKCHLIKILENLKCPVCEKSFAMLYELIEHVGRECSEDIEKDSSSAEVHYEEIIIKQEDSDDDSTNMLIQTLSDNHNGDENAEDAGEANNGNSEQIESELYYCSSCNISFASIKEHIDEYHKGQEVFLEQEEQGKDDSTFFVVQGSNSEEVNEDEEAVSDKETDDSNSNTLKIESCVDQSGCLYTRKVVQIDKFWLDKKPAPLTISYTLQDGKARKMLNEEGIKSEKSDTLNIHQCPSCQVHFIKLEQYYKHNCDKQNSSAYKCSKCDSCFSTTRALSGHMRTHKFVQSGPPENIGPFICVVCNTEFKTFKSLRLHERMHDPVKSREVDPPVNYGLNGIISETTSPVRIMFVCKICNKSYDKQYETVHMQAHMENEKFHCDICNRKFNSQSSLDMHMRVHINGKKFACSYCKKNFITFDGLQDHVKRHCNCRPYECQYCGRRFIRPHEKVKHERIHTGEKPHICQICGKAFRVSYCLTLHMRTHSGTRPYQCPHCGKRFKAHSVFNHHLLTHSNVRNYKCPYCPKAFKTGVQLAGHKNSHTKPFACTECNRPFASLYAVRIHMESHKRENNLKYNCSVCGASYARAFALRDHIKEQHNVASEKVEESLTLAPEYIISEGLAASNSILAESDDNVLVNLNSEVGDSAEIVEADEIDLEARIDEPDMLEVENAVDQEMDDPEMDTTEMDGTEMEGTEIDGTELEGTEMDGTELEGTEMEDNEMIKQEITVG